MEHPARYAGRKVVVLGLAKSGAAAARLFRSFGAEVVASDRKPREQCPEAEELERLGVQVVCGGHPPELIGPDTALVVKNPGIPYSADPIERAAALGIEIVTEVEAAYWLCRASIIGVTGSNGKTTTTAWIGRMLEESGIRVVVAGNIGTPLCDVVESVGEDGWVVAELSSFQLKGTVRFRPKVAVLLNITETHLDYHGSMDDYIASKAKLFANQSDADVAVLNADDAVCRRLAPRLRACVMHFSASGPVERGVFIDVDALVYRDGEGKEIPLVPVAELGVPGRYNAENAAAAACAAMAAGADPDAVRRALRTFRGVEHRMERVAELGGVTYYNNSKATNSTATLRVLEGFGRPVVLIAGGQDRGADFSDLVPVLAEKARGVVALGETGERIGRRAREAGVRDVVVIERRDPVEAMREAVLAASRIARPGDAVVLSPACASWDMFASYEERGRLFKQAVSELAERAAKR